MQPAGPPIKPATPCLCRAEHAADGSGSRVFRSPECPEHAHLLKPQRAPEPLPFGLRDSVAEPRVELGQGYGQHPAAMGFVHCPKCDRNLSNEPDVPVNVDMLKTMRVALQCEQCGWSGTDWKAERA